MYQGTIPLTAGIVVLPNTGGNTLLVTLAVISVAIGVAVLATTAVRFVVKRQNV